jgi:hypothetical protein
LWIFFWCGCDDLGGQASSGVAATLPRIGHLRHFPWLIRKRWYYKGGTLNRKFVIVEVGKGENTR